MLGFRVNSINDNAVGEPDQDANSALTELDKGLRSGKVGEQCEAIVRFPRLFEKYPFPILINSSFLKLADVFRMGNNFLRLWVLRVCQQSEKHLDKILNVDEFLRRVFSVLHSNDPVARALALKTLGAVAGIIPERQNVHHAVRRGLDSHDNVEVDAAIYATTRFAAHSNAFAVAVCNKLADMVECENTGAERRDELVRALRTVHGGAVRAQGVLKLLTSLMERFPSSSCVRAAISSITNIADDTVVHVPDQVEVLLDVAVNDGRAAVRREALLGLRTLAEHAALWPAACIHSLVLAAAARGQDTPHAMLCLQVMQILVKCPAVCAAAGSTLRSAEGELEPSLLRQYCHDAALSVRPSVAAAAARVLTDIVVHCYQESLPVEGADLMVGLESLVIATGRSDGRDNTKPLRIALGCLVELSNVEPTVYAARTAAVLGGQLDSCRWVGEASTPQELARLEALLEALGALAGGIYCPKSIQPAMPAIVAKLQQVAQAAKVEIMETDTPQPEIKLDSGTALVLLCTVACQERCGAALSAKITGEWEASVLAALSGSDGWCKYRVARAALRYGHHRLAASILKQLSAVAPSEAAQRWLTALHRAAAADDALMQEGISGLETASAAWELAGDAGGAGGGGCCGGCGGCGACAGMAGAWCAARAAALSALARAAAAARALCTQPPPATAHANAQQIGATTSVASEQKWNVNKTVLERKEKEHVTYSTNQSAHGATREPSARAGACAGALRRAARAAQAAARRYAAIARAAFYADRCTLRHLQISQHTYNLLSQFLERLTTANYQEKQLELSFAPEQLEPRSLEERAMLAPSRRLRRLAGQLFDDPTTKPGLTHRHAEAVLAAVRACTTGALWPRGACGVSGGGARCRLSLQPAGRGPPADHAATLPVSHHLALKIEGVILPPQAGAGEPPKRLRKKQEERQVKGVQLTVTATPHPRTNEKTVELTNVPPVLTATQTVTPNRDFFSAQQLVSVPSAGLYTVAVEAAFVDQHGVLWQTGPKSSIVIKAHDDPNAKGTTQVARTRF